MEFYLYLTPLSFYCLAQLWLMLWAATCSFINTGPGALWELPVCPLSGFGSWDVSVAPVWECMFAGYGVDRSYFCVLDWAAADYADVSASVFVSVYPGTNVWAEGWGPKPLSGSRWEGVGAVTSKGCRSPLCQPTCPLRGKSCLFGWGLAR